MLPSRFLLHEICLQSFVSLVMAKCNAPTPANYSFTTTKAMNTHDSIFSIFAQSGTVEFTVRPIKGTSAFNGSYYFKVRKIGSRSTLFIKKPLELSLLLEKNPPDICGLGLAVTLTCFDEADKSKLVFKRNFYIRPSAYKFALNFTATEFTVSEDIDLAIRFVNLRDVILNPNSSIAKIAYKANHYIDNRKDAQEILTLEQNGDIFTKRLLDAEGVDLLYYLNVTFSISHFVCIGESKIQAGAVQTIIAIMTFNIVNVNDNAPEFITPGCPRWCGPPNYSTVLSSTHLGEITDIINGPVRAVDADGDEIHYIFVRGSPQSYWFYFEIDQHTGVVSKMMPVYKDDLQFFNITIMAKSLSKLPTATQIRPKDKVYTSLLISIQSSIRHSVLEPRLTGGGGSLPKPICCFWGKILMVVAFLLM